MLKRWWIAAMAALFVWGHVSPASAQKRAVPKSAPAPPVNPSRGGGRGNPNRDPVKELDRFQKMSPEERQKELDKLPPQRRARVEQQMERLDRMTPEQRQRALNRLAAMQKLAPERRQAVNQEIQYLRSLPPDQRRERLHGDEFSGNYSPQEQQLIRELFPRMQ